MTPALRYLLCFLLLFPTAAFAFPGDTLRAGGDMPPDTTTKKKRAPKNYIRPTLYFSRYGTGIRDMRGEPKFLDNRLGNYGFVHYNLGFYAPLFTSSWYRKDSISLANFHLLFTFNTNVAHPTFVGLPEQHRLYKTGFGLRAIYNTGKKSIWFFDASPYAVGDRLDRGTRQPRYASILVWNWTHSPNFSFRLGFTRTFIFGNRLHLPMIGIRFGRLDDKYISLQFPRNITAAWVVNKNVTLSMFSKPFGGLYRFSNKDSLYPANEPVIQFGRWEITSGFKADFNLGSNFSFFVSSGYSWNNRINFASYKFDKNDKFFGIVRPFYKASVDPGLFSYFGMSLRFGKSKRVAGDYRLYEVIDMNNTFDPGDNNDGPGNGQIPAKAKRREMERLKYKDVSDLFDVTDLY